MTQPPATSATSARTPWAAALACRVLVVALVTGLASCRTPPTPEDRSGRARLIGVIESVRPTDRFVLIRSSTSVTDDVGTEIVSYNRDGEETGRMRLSEERRRTMLTADVLSGNPANGDFAVIPGTDGKDWMPQALPPVMIDDGTPTATELPPDLDSLPDLQPPPGVERLPEGTLPDLTLPPGVEPGDPSLPGPPTDLGPLDLPPPPPPGAEHDLLR